MQQQKRLPLTLLETVVVALCLIYSVPLAYFIILSPISITMFGPLLGVTLGGALTLLKGKRALARAFHAVIAFGLLAGSLVLLGIVLVCDKRDNGYFWGSLFTGIVAFLLSLLHSACAQKIHREGV